MATDLTEVIVAPDTFHVSAEPLLLIADLHGALALCLHDEGRGIGGLLHLRFMGGTGRPSDVTDNTLSSVLVERISMVATPGTTGGVRMETNRWYGPALPS